MKLNAIILPLSVLSTLALAFPAPKAGMCTCKSLLDSELTKVDAAVEAGKAKRHDIKARFVPSIIPYKDYSEDEESGASESMRLKARFVPSIIPYKDYAEDTEDTEDLEARFVPSIIPYKDYSEDQEADETETTKKVKARFVPSIIPYKDYAEDTEDTKET